MHYGILKAPTNDRSHAKFTVSVIQIITFCMCTFRQCYGYISIQLAVREEGGGGVTKQPHILSYSTPMVLWGARGKGKCKGSLALNWHGNVRKVGNH